MNNYNFKVVANIREDLKENEKEYIKNYVNEWMKKFNIKKIDQQTYCKDGKITGQDDFGAVSFFYFQLDDEKKYFSKLEYYDIVSPCENRVAI